jgi:hypothetical protein
MPFKKASNSSTSAHARKLRTPMNSSKNVSAHDSGASMLQWNSKLSLSITTLMGNSFTAEINGEKTIAELKELIAEEQNIPVEAIVLVFCGIRDFILISPERVLQYDFYSVNQYNIKDGSTLKLVLQTSSGNYLHPFNKSRTRQSGSRKDSS